MHSWSFFFFVVLVSATKLSCKHPHETSSPAGTHQENTAAKTIHSSSKRPMFLYHGLVLDAERRIVENPSDRDMENLVRASNGNLAALATAGTGSERQLSLTDDFGNAYIELCRDSGVPIPPPLNSKKWTKLGPMDPEKLFSFTPRTELWRYDTPEEPPEGVCAALPRYSRDGEKINLFGIICVNKKSGKTCFWDNSKGKGEALPITDETDVTSLFGADRAVANCTTCHRGDNPWIIFPDQPTAQLPKKIAFVPIGPPNWENPASEHSCGTCHSIPKLTFDYCDILKNMVNRGFMPPDRLLKSDVAMNEEYETIIKDCPARPADY